MSDEGDEFRGPLWCIRSGRFFGEARNGWVFAADGRCVGYMRGRRVVGLTGRVIGEVRAPHWIGRRSGIGYSQHGSRGPVAARSIARRGDRSGLPFGNWTDPLDV